LTEALSILHSSFGALLGMLGCDERQFDAAISFGLIFRRGLV
jgi:hypothetical protein